MEKLEQVRRQIVVVFFAAVFLLGMFLAKDYGMPWDETTEFGIFAANYQGVCPGAGGRGQHFCALGR